MSFRPGTIACISMLIGTVGGLAGSWQAAAQVRIEICEIGTESTQAWPKDPPVTQAFDEVAFGLFELPHQYVGTGVRGDWASPTLVRASARVALPMGRHRLLLRARGPSRLLIDGEVVLETPFWQPEAFATGNAGEYPLEVRGEFPRLGPDFRFAPPGTRESWRELGFGSEPVEVVLETLIGAIESKSKTPFRPELGETVVAWSPQGSNAWRLLATNDQLFEYTDEGWTAYAEGRAKRFAAMNYQARAKRRAAHAPYWESRRAEARRWLDQTEPVAVPELPPGFPANNAIDHFLANRITQIASQHREATPGGIDFFDDVQPILEQRCYDCHQGSKVKGGLRLDHRSDALHGGKFDGPAVVAHDPEKSSIIIRVTSPFEDEIMPAKGDPLTDTQIAVLRQWIEEGANWPDFDIERLDLTPLADDPVFLRRVTLDTVGVVPSETEVDAFLTDNGPYRRTRLIERLLDDPRWADHWMPYWLDVLAENPNLINPTLNNTGPFRWWIHESLVDNKPLDLFVTELIRMDGSEQFGGPAGFGIASENDVPMAAKGIIVGSAFLGMEMKCARCHDAPTHQARQEELFSLAAMLETKPITLPASSSVVMDHLREGGRKPLIEVTLEPGSVVEPAWPFSEYCDETTARALAENPDNPRDLLAALITAPENKRFAQVMANRIWQRFMGRGIVEPVGDWEMEPPSHPDLLRWLGRELVRLDYDLKAFSRLILTSQAYQRAADPALEDPDILFAARASRRITAEQLVDSLFSAAGKPFEVERVALDIDSVRTVGLALDLGIARRAWMLGSTSNERDRPSLTLPRMQAVTEVMEAFGWRGTRPDAGEGVRDVPANPLQPALLANGVMTRWLTRLSDDHEMTHLALEDQPLEALLERVFMRFFTRLPTTDELTPYTAYLSPGYETRRHVDAPPAPGPERPDFRPDFVAWSNHMLSEAHTLRLEEAETARQGNPATNRLDEDWRLRFEDVLWALINAPEWTRVL